MKTISRRSRQSSRRLRPPAIRPRLSASKQRLAEAIENAKPGKGPDDSWATTDLDVNDDNVVDKGDLEALEQSEASAGADGEAPPI